MARQLGNPRDLRSAWSLPNIRDKKNWGDWFTSVTFASVRQSSSAALRACVPLLDVQIPVAKEVAKDLFQIAFLSVWCDANEDLRVRVFTNEGVDTCSDPSA
jgi:FKBP12-rapamycin complex-associated protein